MDNEDFSQRLERIDEAFRTSPKLVAAWNSHNQLRNAYASYLMERVGEISPPVPRELIPHKPLLRIWSDATGWSDSEPYSLTVFYGHGFTPACRVRRAVWHCKDRDKHFARIESFACENGDASFDFPDIEIDDAEASYEDIRSYLSNLESCTIPVVTLQPPDYLSASTDVGNVGFEYYSHDQPPARIRLQWSVDPPDSWSDTLSVVGELRDYLLSRLDTTETERQGEP